MKDKTDILGLKAAHNRRMAPVNTPAKPVVVDPKVAAAAKRKAAFNAAVAKMKAQGRKQK